MNDNDVKREIDRMTENRKLPMNQRIKELALQADLMRYPSDGINIKIEHFANLIVQDVLNLFGDELISLHYLEQPCCEDAVFLLQSKIKDHFYEKPYHKE